MHLVSLYHFFGLKESIVSKQITVLNNTFTLHPHGAAFWKEQQMLLLADAHFGKTAHFRKHGIAVPNGVAETDYAKLKGLVVFFQPKTICFLGDLFHSYLNSEWILFEEWAQQTSTEKILIKGNHDIIPEHKLEVAGIMVFDKIETNGFMLTHHPTEAAYFNICGHVHPGIKLKGEGKQYLKLPCFFKSEKQLILPAFGDLTGTYTLIPTKKDTVFAVTPEEVILIQH